MASLGFKLFGRPPADDAPRSARLRWIRGFYLRPLPLLLVGYATLALWASGAILVLAGVSALIWLQGVISLSMQIRREERFPPRT